MHPTREHECDAVLEHPLLSTPPAEEMTGPPRPSPHRRPKEIKLLHQVRRKADAMPPSLLPELYLQPRRLQHYARQIENNLRNNRELLKQINIIQRTGGFVDCWLRQRRANAQLKLLSQKRQNDLAEIRVTNAKFVKRIVNARSDQPRTKELELEWKKTKEKLVLGASLPFILFKAEKIDRDIKDPKFDRPPGVHRNKVGMEVWVVGGSKVGRVVVELFTDVVPDTCRLFMRLLRGDERGYGYQGTRIFRIVPNLYCRSGDVTLDNGFGCYTPGHAPAPPATSQLTPENFELQHSVPGTLSMVVNADNEVCGQFNIIFKPLPQFDGKHVVFGRIVAGPPPFLERISALGLPLGATQTPVVLRRCGWYNRSGQYRDSKPNTIQFPWMKNA